MCGEHVGLDGANALDVNGSSATRMRWTIFNGDLMF